MNPSDVIRAEAGGVEQIVLLAQKVETLRRGSAVDRHDEAVQVMAAELILNLMGAELRQRFNEPDEKRIA
jgi:hypothetical protein